MNPNFKAYLMLLLISIIWGATFPIIHDTVQNVNPILFVLIRFGVASLVLLPFISKEFKKFDKITLIFGILLGLVNSCTFIFQSVALQTINSSETAFLTTTYIILVPLMLPLFGFRRPNFSELVAAIICLIGIYIITDAQINSIKIGDVWIIASAVSIALGLIVVEYVSKYSHNKNLFNFYQILFTTLVPVAILKFPYNLPHNPNFWLSIIYCAVLATSIAFLIQVKYQSTVGASKTALIFSLEAVFASIFASINGEHISLRVIIGGSIILISTLITDIKHLIKPN